MQDTALNLETGLEQGIAPGVDLSFIMPLIITSIVISGLLTVLFLIYVIFNTIRRYKVEKATFDMQKDIRRMRELMEQGSMPSPTTSHDDKDLLAHATPAETNPTDDAVLAKIESEQAGQI